MMLFPLCCDKANLQGSLTILNLTKISWYDIHDDVKVDYSIYKVIGTKDI